MLLCSIFCSQIKSWNSIHPVIISNRDCRQSKFYGFFHDIFRMTNRFQKRKGAMSV
jgi:hypothetical protein